MSAVNLAGKGLRKLCESHRTVKNNNNYKRTKSLGGFLPKKSCTFLFVRFLFKRGGGRGGVYLLLFQIMYVMY